MIQVQHSTGCEKGGPHQISSHLSSHAWPTLDKSWGTIQIQYQLSSSGKSSALERNDCNTFLSGSMVR